MHPPGLDQAASAATFGAGSQVLFLARASDPDAKIGPAALLNAARRPFRTIPASAPAMTVGPGLADLRPRARSATAPRSAAGAVVIPDITIGAGANVGAGAAVVSDVADGEAVVGVPARPIERAQMTGAELPDPIPAPGDATRASRSSDYFELSRAAGWYSNGGPCYRLLAERLGERIGGGRSRRAGLERDLGAARSRLQGLALDGSLGGC